MNEDEVLETADSLMKGKGGPAGKRPGYVPVSWKEVHRKPGPSDYHPIDICCDHSMDSIQSS